MPTWAEVQEYARSKYKLVEESENSFKLVWEYGNNRLQQIVVSRFEAMEREWCDFASPACKREDLEPEDALKKNYEFALGALCLDGDVYIVRYSTQMATMDLDEFELPLHVVASTADQIEADYAAKDDF